MEPKFLEEKSVWHQNKEIPSDKELHLPYFQVLKEDTQSDLGLRQGWRQQGNHARFMLSYHQGNGHLADQL